MSIRKYLDTKPLFDIAKYDKTSQQLKDAVPFLGSPRKHPYDDDKLLLISNPFSSETCFYEFLITDIIYYEDRPSLGTEGGETLTIVKLWVKKGSIGMRSEAFEVAEPLRFMNDSELLHQVLSD